MINKILINLTNKILFYFSVTIVIYANCKVHKTNLKLK